MRFLAYENVAKFYGCEFLLKKFELLPLMLLESIDKPSMTDQVSFAGIYLIKFGINPDISIVFVIRTQNHLQKVLRVLFSASVSKSNILSV